MSRIAVVILNYNGEKLLQQFLPSVIANSGRAAIYVADNGSSDSSVYTLEAEFPTVNRILLKNNFGFCGGYNRALKEVDAEYYVLLNSDVEVTPGWLDPLFGLLENNLHIGAVQPKILSFTRRTHFEYAGAGGGFIDAFGYPFCRGRVFEHVEQDHHQYDDIRPVFWSSGACMMIRSSLFHESGGFDEDFFAHMEEIDLCWKLQRAGSAVYYCGQSTVYHLGAGTLGYGSPRKAFFNFRNGLTMMVKHYSSTELITRLPVRVALDWVAAVSFLLKGKPRLTWAVFRAHAAVIRTLPRTVFKRRVIQKGHPNYPRTQVFPGLVLLHSAFWGRKPINFPNNPK